ncbi:MAG: nucleotidyltransferase family protein [Chloroflexi bacterium]|nr:nucleotidyltransferase family protein [Chloroflexota bacterium]
MNITAQGSRTASTRGRSDLNRFRRILKRHMPDLENRYNVRSLGIFGSYVRGEQRKRSDLDVLVEFAKSPDLFEFTALADDLEHLLGVKVDLVSRNGLQGRLAERILSEVVPV